MKTDRQTQALAARVFRQKRARRRALAALSFPAKISVLVQLQQMASEVQTAAGRNYRTAWNLAR
jgi:hypothetical protein